MLELFTQSDKAKTKSSALDALTANIMIADAGLTMSFMNPALISLLQSAEADLKKDLPRFSVATLIGSDIDVFHKTRPISVTCCPAWKSRVMRPSGSAATQSISWSRR